MFGVIFAADAWLAFRVLEQCVFGSGRRLSAGTGANDAVSRPESHGASAPTKLAVGLAGLTCHPYLGGNYVQFFLKVFSCLGLVLHANVLHQDFHVKINSICL